MIRIFHAVASLALEVVVLVAACVTAYLVFLSCLAPILRYFIS